MPPLSEMKDVNKIYCKYNYFINHIIPYKPFSVNILWQIFWIHLQIYKFDDKPQKYVSAPGRDGNSEKHMLYYGKGGVVMLKVKQSEKEIQLKAGNYFLAKTEEKKGRNALF